MGPVPATPPRTLVLLLLLTAVTGCVDAVSFLRLEHVFTANMTGNVVLLGFALGGVDDLSVIGSLLSLAGFLLGAYAGGRIVRRGGGASRTVTTCLTVQTGIVCALAVVLAVSDPERHEAVRLVVTFLLAGAMAVQTSAARYVGVAGITTVVATTTLHGLLHDTGVRGRPAIPPLVPVGIVVALAGGAAAGTAAIQLSTWVGLALAGAVLAALTLASARGAFPLPPPTPAARPAPARAPGAPGTAR